MSKANAEKHMRESEVMIRVHGEVDAANPVLHIWKKLSVTNRVYCKAEVR